MDEILPPEYDQPRLLEEIETLRARLADAEARLEQRNATEVYLSALHQTALTLMNHLDLDKLMATILNAATHLIGTPHGFIQLVKADGSAMNFTASSGIFEGRWETTWHGDGSLTGAVWETEQAIVIDDYEAYAGRIHTIPQNLFHAIASLPLKGAHKFIGVLALAFIEAGRTFSREDILLLKGFAEMASIALDNAQLYSALQAELETRTTIEAKLRESEERYRIITNLISDDAYAVRVEPDGTLVTEWIAHVASSPIIGFASHEILSREHYVGYHPDDRARAEQDVQRVLRGETVSAEYRVFTKDEEFRWVAISRVPEWDAAHEHVVRFYAGVKDITEQLHLEQQQLELALERERLQMCINVMSDLSHDLKTPLAIINSSIYLLENLTDPQRQRDKIEAIKMQTQQLDKLIRDILMLSRLDHVPQLNCTSTDLNHLIRNIIPRFYTTAEQKRIRLTMNLCDDLPLLPIDEDEFSRVIANLVENAIQYTFAGGSVTIKSALQAESVLLEVIDTGIGISEADLPHIFSRFYRADKARNSSQGGTGLGLAIVKKIVEMHNGTVEVESVQDVGSTFRIRLALANTSH
jgi:PAS domain S-box-containing protein